MNDRIESLQGLRAYAALAVLLVHAKFVLPGGISVGSLGVHIFFVISGFIIAHICATNPACFLRRRIARVAPPYWTLTLLVFATALAAPKWLHGTTADPVNLLKSLLFIPYMKASGALQPMLFVGWSLNWEMLFYALVSVCLFVSQRYASLLGASLVVALCIVSAWLREPGDVLLAFYSNPAGYEFVLGALAFEIVVRADAAAVARHRDALTYALIAALAALILAEWTLHGHLMFVALAALSFVAVCSATLLSAAGFDLRNTWLIAIGNASYIMYLIHPFCFSLYQNVVSNRYPRLAPDHAIGLILCVAIVVAVSRFLHTYAELPCYRRLRRLFEHRTPKDRGHAASPVQLQFEQRDTAPRFWRQR
jgi:exopolysaccharide production protein ExoZ